MGNDKNPKSDLNEPLKKGDFLLYEKQILQKINVGIAFIGLLIILIFIVSLIEKIYIGQYNSAFWMELIALIFGGYIIKKASDNRHQIKEEQKRIEDEMGE